MDKNTRTFGYPLMHTIIPTGEKGIFKIQHFTLTENDSLLRIHNFRCLMKRDYIGYVLPGTYVKLSCGNEIIMSDTQLERITNQDILIKAHGRVLIAGLGIGMVPCGICKSPEVTSVTIIEKSQEVIDLVVPHLPDYVKAKINVIQADIFTWRPEHNFDTIYFDIWPDRVVDNLKEIKRLHRTFRRYLNLEGWMGSWYQKQLQSKGRKHA